jgi:hypothetical protein
MEKRKEKREQGDVCFCFFLKILILGCCQTGKSLITKSSQIWQ